MITAKYIYWRDGAMWLGYFEEFPDYMTQGESLEDLQGNLREIYQALNSGSIPAVRRAAELAIA